MKKLLMLLPLLLLVSCTKIPQLVVRNETVVYTNDGDQIVSIYVRFDETETPIIKTEYWNTLTIDDSLAYLELDSGTLLFSINIYTIVIAEEVW